MSNSTPIDIANQALTAGGARGQIGAFTDNSPEARYVRLYYDDTLEQFLRGAHWNFARKMGLLTLLLAQPGTPENTTEGTATWVPGAQPQPPWLYEYAYPSDCLLMRYISPQLNTSYSGGIPLFSTPSYVPSPSVQLQPQRFVVSLDDALGGGPRTVVLNNVTQSLAVYTARRTNPVAWDPSFRSGFVAALAKRLCIPVGGNAKLIPQLNAEARATLMAARVSDGNEGLTFAADTQRPPDWITVRGYAGDWAGTSYYTMMWQNPSFLIL